MRSWHWSWEKPAAASGRRLLEPVHPAAVVCPAQLAEIKTSTVVADTCLPEPKGHDGHRWSWGCPPHAEEFGTHAPIQHGPCEGTVSPPGSSQASPHNPPAAGGGLASSLLPRIWDLPVRSSGGNDGRQALSHL